MKAVILCAGKSTRTYPLTLTRPKSLLKVANKTILEHTLSQLEGLVEEVILIVGYKKEMIQGFGNSYKSLKLSYVEQRQQLGTGHALIQVKGLTDNFVLMNGDDLYFKEDIKKCIKHENCVLVKEVENISDYGAVSIKDNYVEGIVEKPRSFDGNLANAGLYVFDESIFDLKIDKSERGEYEITDFVNKLCKMKDMNYETAVNWQPITFAWNLLDANELLLKGIETKIEGVVEDRATIKGNIILGKNSIVKNGVYIEGNVVIGENTTVGPNCFIRGFTSIGNNCRVGNAVEIKNSIIMDSTNVCHLAYVGDSILGENVNYGAGAVSANLRHDNNHIHSFIKDGLIGTKRKKLGVIIGDNAKIGINTSIYPGRKIWPNKVTMPCEVITKDVV